jgi:hypothetical protein
MSTKRKVKNKRKVKLPSTLQTNVSVEEHDVVQRIAELEGSTVSQTIRRAIRAYAHQYDQLLQSGFKAAAPQQPTAAG